MFDDKRFDAIEELQSYAILKNYYKARCMKIFCWTTVANVLWVTDIILAVCGLFVMRFHNIPAMIMLLYLVFVVFFIYMFGYFIRYQAKHGKDKRLARVEFNTNFAKNAVAKLELRGENIDYCIGTQDADDLERLVYLLLCLAILHNKRKEAEKIVSKYSKMAKIAESAHDDVVYTYQLTEFNKTVLEYKALACGLLNDLYDLELPFIDSDLQKCQAKYKRR